MAPRIDEALVRRLVAAQFPRWSHLPVRPVEPQGWDNRSFRLGEDLVVRLPSDAAYAAQPAREARWLPVLAPQLPVPVPRPVALGTATGEYPWEWSVRSWVDGDVARPGQVASHRDFAIAVGQFLAALQRADAAAGPSPGAENFHRGASLAVYDAQVREALPLVRDRVDEGIVLRIWSDATACAWDREPVWVHGDIAPGNLLVDGSRLAGVIDFGCMAVGDPACDLAIAWTVFDAPAREAFRSALALDDATWRRGRAWALWKALIVAAGLAGTNAIEFTQDWRVLETVVHDGIAVG